MSFLHDGAPQLNLSAIWKQLTYLEPKIPHSINYSEILKKLLSSPNITSKERVIRKYDYEFKGQSIVKPIMNGPSDACVIKPLFDSMEGLVISHGICPRYIGFLSYGWISF